MSARHSTIPPHGAGRVAFRKLPGGFTISRGLNDPWFTGVSGSRQDLTMRATALNTIAGPTLVGPLVCGEEPVKSATRRSPATVRASRPRSGAVPCPSLSR